MKISVGMTTYNGADYLLEQLQSILQQERLADEVVICDDGSTDATCAIVTDFIEANALQSTWTLYRNPHNLGFVRNFKYVASKLTGDLLFLSDQDDIWMPQKLRVMVEVFERHPEVTYLETHRTHFTGNLVTGNLEPFMTRQEQNVPTDRKLAPMTFQEAICLPLGTAMKMGVRRAFYEEWKDALGETPIWLDHGLCAIAAAKGEAYFYNEIAAYYRVHARNVSMAKRTLKSRRQHLGRRIQARQDEVRCLDAYLDMLGDILSPPEQVDIHQARNLIIRKIDCIQHRRILPLIGMLFVKNPFWNRKVCLADVYCILFGDYHDLRNLSGKPSPGDSMQYGNVDPPSSR